MKVLLARPPAPNSLSFTGLLDNEPLELEYLHTALMTSDHLDYIYDALTDSCSFEEVLKREQPDIVAVTGYITQQLLMRDYCTMAKNFDPAIKTIVGGVHAQLNYQSFFHKDIDYICRSEDIWAFAELIDHIAFAKGDLHLINGLCYKSSKPMNKGEASSSTGYPDRTLSTPDIIGGAFPSMTVNELASFDINLLPIPDRTHFHANKKGYRYLELTEIATIKTSLSCPYDCSFCYCTLLNKGCYVTRDIEKVIEELEGIESDNIQIADDDFLVDIKRIEKFIGLVRSRGIKKTYTCYARADFIASNPEIIEKLAQIGFRYFLVGLEAADDEALDSYNKKTSSAANELCIRNIKDAGAECIGLMIADIDYTKKDFDRLYRWIRKNRLSYVTVSIFTPIPGTVLFEKHKDEITSRNIEDWDFLHLVMKPTNISSAEFYLYFYILFLRLYRIAKKSGAYSFIDYSFYKSMLSRYLKAQIKHSLAGDLKSKLKIALKSGSNKRTD